MTVHHFEPTQYYTTIGSHAPALVVEDGDTVVTTTVMRMGRAQAATRSPRRATR